MRAYLRINDLINVIPIIKLWNTQIDAFKNNILDKGRFERGDMTYFLYSYIYFILKSVWIL